MRVRWVRTQKRTRSFSTDSSGICPSRSRSRSTWRASPRRPPRPRPRWLRPRAPRRIRRSDTTSVPWWGGPAEDRRFACDSRFFLVFEMLRKIRTQLYNENKFDFARKRCFLWSISDVICRTTLMWSKLGHSTQLCIYTSIYRVDSTDWVRHLTCESNNYYTLAK